MPHTVFHASSPQRRRAKQRTTILNLLRGHTPPGGTSAADARPIRDRRRAAFSGRVEGRSSCTRSVGWGSGSPYQRSS
jgi:hypothetical protein